jgi:hypothetical protein
LAPVGKSTGTKRAATLTQGGGPSVPVDLSNRYQSVFLIFSNSILLNLFIYLFIIATRT